MRQARKAGFVAVLYGPGSSQWKVTNPLTGEHTVVGRNVAGPSLGNELGRLRKIGFEPGIGTLRSVPDQPAEVSAVEEQPALELLVAPESAIALVEEPALPKVADVARVTGAVQVTGKGSRPTEDLPGTAWYLWSVVHDEGETTTQDLDGVAGVLWRGSLTAKVAVLWPELDRNDQARSDITGYLRASGNMICLKRRDRPPLWWLTTVWIEAKHEPTRMPTTRTERRLTPAQAGEDRLPAPVVVGQVEADPLVAITRIVERQRALEAENATLRKLNDDLIGKNEVLAEDNAALLGKLGRFQQAFKDLAS